ncbi:MAG: CHAT domain-containing protein [Acidobacteriota bacterium]|nr:CHAT domain-containing protein [Acidobacteriota bacterium]
MLSDDYFFQEFELLESELNDSYVQGTLSAEERKLFEKHLLQSSQQRKRLAFATALNEASAARAATKNKVVSSEKGAPKRDLFSPNFLKIAAVLIVVAGLAVALWVLLGRKSDVDRGMLALNQAYKSERLVESRISEVNYSPLRQTRGEQSPNIDGLARSQAELILLEATRTRGDAASLHALGRLYLAEKKFDRAKEQFEQALKLDSNDAQLQSDLAAALLELGRADRGNDAGKAAENFGKSLEHINRALELNSSSLEALFNRALLLEQLVLLPQAEEAWRTYLQKDSTSQWAGEARRHLQLLEEHNKKALQSRGELYQQFLIAYSNHDRESAWTAIARSRSRMGNQIVERLVTEHLDLAIQKQDNEAAARLKMLSFAAEVEVERVGDRYTLDLASFYSRKTEARLSQLAHARSLSAAGLERYNQSEFEPAIQLYTDALRQFKALGNSCEALSTESWIGYSELRRAGTGARERFQRLAKLYEEKSYKSLQAQAIHALSDAWTDDNELSKVLDLAGQALRIAEAIQDDSTKLRCLQQFVTMNLKFGKYIDALSYGMDAIQISQSFLSEPKLIWTFYHELALGFHWLGLPVAALEFETRALELAKQSAWPYIIVRSYTQLGVIYERQKDYARAIRYGSLAVAEGQKFRDEKSRLTIVSNATLRLGHFYRGAGDFKSALANYDSALRMFEQLDLAVFRYETHKGRFMALLGVNNIAAADQELSRALSLFEQYRIKIQEEQNRNSFFDVGQDIYDLAIDFAYTELNNPVKAFDYAEQSRARSLLDYLNAAPQLMDSKEGPDLQHASQTHATRFADIRERLPAGVQILQYSLGDDKLILWVASRNGIDSRVVPISKQPLDEKISAFLKQIARGVANDETTATSRELYSILIDPIEPLLDKHKQLCIVPDKTLVRLPFAALTSATDGKFLVEKFALLTAWSTNVFIACTDSAQHRPRVEAERALTVGNPNFSTASFPDLPALPSAEREAREVASCYHSLPLIGSNARERKVRSGMTNVEVIHLASHFVVDPRSPMLSKLLLTKETGGSRNEANSDGFLQVSEVYGMKLPRARLVVLSACQTGIEKTYQGEGAMSIARSFISAGVPLVVATLWPVESDTTSELMVRFHHYRKVGGFSTVEALRRAQLDMIRSTDQTRNTPNAWASFVTVGGYAAF